MSFSTLTGVPVERQKLLYKGKTIKDDADLRSLPTAGGLKFMFMGTAEDKVEAKEASKKTVFLEDLTPSQQAALLREKQIEPLPNVRGRALLLKKYATITLLLCLCIH